MKTKNNKRILAWVLSVCMAIALLPAMPAEYAQAAEEDLVYKFTGMLDSAYVDASSASSTDSWGHMAATNNAFSPTDLSKALTFAYTQAKSSAPWCVADVYNYDREQRTHTNLKLYANTGIYAYAYGNATARIARAGVLLRVADGEEGWYRIKPSYKFSTAASGVATMSLYDKGTFTGDEIPINAVFTPEENKLLSTVTANTTAGKVVSADMGVKYLTAGDYYFRIQCQAVTGASGQHNIWVENVTFEKVAFSIVPSATSATVEEDASTEITLALNEAGASLSDVTYSAAVTGGAETTVSGNTLTVKGVSAGDATVTVTAKVGDSTVATLDIPVTVTAPAPEAHPTFGTSYAYIREDYVDGETQYKLILIAAVNSLDYSKVGFNYTLGDAAEASTEETSAYKTLTLGEASLTAADLGVADGYLFYSEIDIAAADAEKGITFNAYADNGVVSEGGSLAITSVVNKAQ